jgi:hypothetical protein
LSRFHRRGLSNRTITYSNCFLGSLTCINVHELFPQYKAIIHSFTILSLLFTEENLSMLLQFFCAEHFNVVRRVSFSSITRISSSFLYVANSLYIVNIYIILYCRELKTLNFVHSHTLPSKRNRYFRPCKTFPSTNKTDSVNYLVSHFGSTDDESSIKLLKKALDIGCTFWDTAG